MIVELLTMYFELTKIIFIFGYILLINVTFGFRLQPYIWSTKYIPLKLNFMFSFVKRMLKYFNNDIMVPMNLTIFKYILNKAPKINAGDVTQPYQTFTDQIKTIYQNTIHYYRPIKAVSQ